MIRKIFRGILMSVIILIIAIAISLFVKLLQTFCPIVFAIFSVVIILGAGFFFANIIWQ